MGPSCHVLTKTFLVANVKLLAIETCLIIIFYIIYWPILFIVHLYLDVGKIPENFHFSNGFLRVFQCHTHKRLSEGFLHAQDSCFSASEGGAILRKISRIRQ
jgi:hypothetical protein